MPPRLGVAFAALIGLIIVLVVLITSGAVVPRLLGVTVIAIGYLIAWIREHRRSR